jgi:hypothetical protein
MFRRGEHIPGRQGKTWPFEKSRHTTADSDVEIVEVSLGQHLYIKLRLICRFRTARDRDSAMEV